MYGVNLTELVRRAQLTQPAVGSITPARPGTLGIPPLPKLPADLVALREMAGELRTLAYAEKDRDLAGYISVLSDTLQVKSERFVVVGSDERVLFGGRQWTNPQTAAEHALHELSADEIREERIVAWDYDEDGHFAVTVAEVVELEP